MFRHIHFFISILIQLKIVLTVILATRNVTAHELAVIYKVLLLL